MAKRQDTKLVKRVKSLPAKTLTAKQAKRVSGGIVVQGTRLCDGSVTKVADPSTFKLTKY